MASDSDDARFDCDAANAPADDRSMENDANAKIAIARASMASREKNARLALRGSPARGSWHMFALYRLAAIVHSIKITA